MVLWHDGPLGELDVRVGDGELASYRVTALNDLAVAWLVRLDDERAQADAGRAAASSDDLADLAGRPHAAMRVMRRRLLKALLARLSDSHPDHVRINRDILDRPRIVAPHGWYASVAGRWPVAMIGAARVPLGVDIEPVSAAPPPSDAFTAAELRALRDAEPGEALRRWVAKEAHAKCRGNAAQVEAAMIDTQAAGAVLHSVSDGIHCRCHLRTLRGHVLALAVPSSV